MTSYQGSGNYLTKLSEVDYQTQISEMFCLLPMAFRQQVIDAEKEVPISSPDGTYQKIDFVIYSRRDNKHLLLECRRKSIEVDDVCFTLQYREKRTKYLQGYGAGRKIEFYFIAPKIEVHALRVLKTLRHETGSVYAFWTYPKFAHKVLQTLQAWRGNEWQKEQAALQIRRTCPLLFLHQH